MSQRRKHRITVIGGKAGIITGGRRAEGKEKQRETSEERRARREKRTGKLFIYLDHSD